MPWNFRHWSVSEIDHRQTGACCACSRYGTFLFVPFFGHCFMAANIGKKKVQHMLPAIAVLYFPICAEKKLSRTCCTCSRGGSPFLPYPIQPHPLNPLIMARLKMTSHETFQSNMIKNTTNVTSILMLFHGFRPAGK